MEPIWKFIIIKARNKMAISYGKGFLHLMPSKMSNEMQWHSYMTRKGKIFHLSQKKWIRNIQRKIIKLMYK